MAKASTAAKAQRIREEQGREALVAWLGPAAEVSPEEREAIRAEWGADLSKRRGRRPAGSV